MQSPDAQGSDRSVSVPVLGRLAIVFCKGLAMGAADSVPGVSGGTIALITGIYERLIRAVTALDPRILLQITTVHRRRGRAAFKRELLEMDVPFLVALGLGMVTAVAILARLVQVALSTVPGPTFAFFLGLIGASAIVLFEWRWLSRPGPVLAAVLGFLLAFLVAGETATDSVTHTLPVIFGSGALAISGMVLPGISGAFILLLLGQYDHMTATLNSVIDQFIVLVRGGDSAAFIDAASTVVVFLAGAFVGLFTVAYVVRAALERYRIATFAFLVSLMLGALRFPLLRIYETTELYSVSELSGVVLAAVGGLGAVLVLNYYTEDLDYTDEGADTATLRRE